MGWSGWGGGVFTAKARRAGRGAEAWEVEQGWCWFFESKREGAEVAERSGEERGGAKDLNQDERGFTQMKRWVMGWRGGGLMRF
jgi:hypothetical protein